MSRLHMGIDVGSTTVKVVVLDENNNTLFAEYRRHFSDIKSTVKGLFAEVKEVVKNEQFTVVITGSGGLLLSKMLDLPFVQEVIANKTAIKTFMPETDVVIELGGEDAKILYLSGGLEQRMNGTCAGGTGAFIDQMAILLKTDASGLNEKTLSLLFDYQRFEHEPELEALLDEAENEYCAELSDDDLAQVSAAGEAKRIKRRGTDEDGAV